ncbi:MAG: PaaX family transcriptional regulator C-terminal domain-containing protein [Patescibacteria group bacterium]
MVKFEEMYQPITRNPFRIDPFDSLRGINEYRQIKRAQIHLTKKDLISVTGPVGGKKLVLTSRAHRIFFEEYPLAKLRSKKWDGYWTILMYDFPEKLRNLRNELRSKLIELGFGSPQESVLITPLPIHHVSQELIEGEEVEKFTWVLKAKRVLGVANREIAERAWGLNELNSLYLKLIKVLPKIRTLGRKDLLQQWREYFLALNAADPYLPFELLPENWAGEKCKNTFTKFSLKDLLIGIFK